MAVKKKSVTKKKAVSKKAATKKAVSKSVAKKAAVKKKSVAKTATAAPKAIKEPMTKAALYATIAETTDIPKKDVVAVFDALSDIINGHVKKRAAGNFTLPGLLKITTIKKPAKKARKGINPFTGEETMFKAKPAQTVVKIRPLKKLKDFVND